MILKCLKGDIVVGLGKLKSFQMLKLLNESKTILDLTLVDFQIQLRKTIVQNPKRRLEYTKL